MMEMQRRQFLQNTALLGLGLFSNLTFGDRDEKYFSATTADSLPNDFVHISPSGEFFLYYLSAACNT